jgi:hypothetical protein
MKRARIIGVATLAAFAVAVPVVLGGLDENFLRFTAETQTAI